MKQLVILFTFFLVISLNKINAQTVGLDNTNPSVFTKFRVPDTDLRSIWFNTGLNLHTNRTDYKSQDYYTQGLSFSENSDFTYNFSPKYYLLQESDSKYLKLNASIFGSYNKNSFSSKYIYYGYTSTNKQTNYSLNLTTDFKLNNYINNGNSFYSVGASANVIMDDQKREESGSVPYPTIHSGDKSQDYSLSFGVGIGKFRNVTPVVSAIRFQERLKQLNMINNNLSNNAIEKLASQFYKQTYYSDVYDRPNKYFWQDIEKSLDGEGVSLNDLNMYAANYLMETVNEIRFFRQEGIMGGVNLQFNYSNIYSTQSGQHAISEQLFMLVNAYLNYSTQLNLNSQLGFDVSLFAGPNIIAHPWPKQKYAISADIEYDYEITDRLVASINNTFAVLFYIYSNEEKLLSNNLSLSFRYFVEDNLSLSASYNWQYHDNKQISSNYFYTSKGNYLNIGFTYYLQRGFLY